MTIQQLNSTASVASSYNSPAVNQQRVATAFDASTSSIASMSHAEEGVVGDFFEGAWSVITWPVRTVASVFSRLWSWVTGSSAAAPAAPAAPASTNPLADLGAAIKAKKFKTDDFKSAWAALPADQQKQFKAILWVAGGHKTKDHGKDWAGEFLAKKKFNSDNRDLLKDAFKMMDAKPKMAEMAQRLGEEGLKNSKEVKKECYNGKALPDVVKKQVKDLGYLIANGELPTSDVSFETSKAMIKPYKRALEILGENDFVLVRDIAARRELMAMDQYLVAVEARHGSVEAHDIAPHYNSLGEKSAAVLAEIVGSAAGFRGKGDAYIRGVHVDSKGALVAVDTRLVRSAIYAMLNFDTRKV